MILRIVSPLIGAVAGAFVLSTLSWWFSQLIGTLDIYRNWWASLAFGAIAGLALGLCVGGKNSQNYKRLALIVFGLWVLFLGYQFVVVWIQFGEPFNL